MLDGKDVDAEVTKDAVTQQFCLKLPQTFFGDGATADEEIEDMVRYYRRQQKKANEGKDEAALVPMIPCLHIELSRKSLKIR